MVKYKLYNNKTLYYMQYILYQINQIKAVFRDIKQIDIMNWVNKMGYFNFP